MVVIEGFCVILVCYIAITENHFLVSLNVEVLKNKFVQDFKALLLLKHGVVEEEEGEKVKFLIYIPLCSSKNLRCLTRIHGVKYMYIYSEQRKIQIGVHGYDWGGS